MRKRRSLIMVAAALTGAIVAGVSYATIPGPRNVYSACMLKGIGTVRLIDKSLPDSNLMSRCKPSLELEVSWNQAGQQGAPGIQGPKGDPGTPGATGANGDNGVDGEDGVSVVSDSSGPGVGGCAHGGAKFTAANSVTYACNGIPGSKGDTGAPGNAGPEGPPGQSVTGVDGLWGDSGRIDLDWSGGGFVGFHSIGVESRNSYTVPFAVTYSTFDCVQSGGHPESTAKQWLRINGVDVATPCVMDGTATSASVTGSHVLTPGDVISVRVLTTGTSAGQSAQRGMAWRLH